eukprot:522252_1
MTNSYSMPSPSNNINNIRIKPRLPGLKKQVLVTLPLNPVYERKPKQNKQLWKPRKNKRATFSLINLPPNAINTINETSESLNDNYDMEYEDDIEWQ